MTAAPEKQGRFESLIAFLLALAMTSGLFIWLEVLLFYSSMDSRAEVTQREWQIKPALLYTHDLPAGSVLTADDLLAAPVSAMLDTPRTLHADAQGTLPGKRLAVTVRAGDAVRTQDFGIPRETDPGPIHGPVAQLFLGQGSQNLRAGDRLTLVQLTEAKEAFVVAERVLLRAVGGVTPPGPVSGNAPVTLELPADAADQVEAALKAGQILGAVEPRR